MRIISGKYGGLQLVGKLPSNVRPTTDLSRETIFNILSNIIDFDNTRVLDLFAGTGALGIEALSRGASYVHFVDNSFHSISIIKMNLEKLKIPNNFIKISKQSVEKFLSTCNEEFDLIFADPPYQSNYFNTICNKVLENHILSENGILIFEMPIHLNPIIPQELSLLKIKELGTTKFYLLNYKK